MARYMKDDNHDLYRVVQSITYPPNEDRPEPLTHTYTFGSYNTLRSARGQASKLSKGGWGVATVSVKIQYSEAEWKDIDE